jgi:hypothetical protein
MRFAPKRNLNAKFRLDPAFRSRPNSETGPSTKSSSVAGAPSFRSTIAASCVLSVSAVCHGPRQHPSRLCSDQNWENDGPTEAGELFGTRLQECRGEIRRSEVPPERRISGIGRVYLRSISVGGASGPRIAVSRAWFEEKSKNAGLFDR